MKTSKILFITLISLGAIYIIAAMIEVRITGKKPGEFSTTLKSNKKELGSFSVLVLNSSRNIRLVESETNYLEVLVPDDSPSAEINYSLSGDTLRINNPQTSELSIVFATLHAAKGLKTIYLEDSDLQILKFSSENLSLLLNNSKARFVINKSDYPTIGSLQITAFNKSTVDLNTVNIDTIGILLQNSSARMQIPTKLIKGELSENSELNAQQPSEISVKRDSTSKMTFYNR